MAQNKEGYWDEYYKKNRGRLLMKHKQLYRNDSEFSDAKKERERRRYRRKTGEPAVSKLRDKVLSVGGREIVLHSMGVLAAKLGVCDETVKTWESAEVVPPATLIDDAGRRWYSDAHIEVMKKAVLAWKGVGGGALSRLKELAWTGYEKSREEGI